MLARMTRLHRGYRSRREAWTVAVACNVLVPVIIVTFAIFDYPYVWAVALSAAVGTANCLTWLAWKRWGRNRFPLRTHATAECN